MINVSSPYLNTNNFLGTRAGGPLYHFESNQSNYDSSSFTYKK